ncbi:MAG: TraB/GumN family protein [Sphingomonadaceae bacterium]|jgi:hypothetical protein
MNTLYRLVAAMLSALAALLVFPATARDASPAPDPVEVVRAPEAVEKLSPALWKVADEDTTVYLFGTIHVLPEGVHWFDGEVAKAFHASDTLVTEIIEGDPAAMQGLVFQKAMLPEGESLRALLSEDQKGAYEAALGEYKIPPALFDRFEPWYAAVGLSTLPLMQDGYNADHGVEKTLDDHAKAGGTEHLALETAEYQLDLFDALPVEVQTRYLGEVIEQMPTIRSQLGKMVEAWKVGDVDLLTSLMDAERSDPVLVKTLLTDRNANWAKWIEARMDEPGTVFVAVGAGHLAGEGSLQDQLAALDIASERLQ